MNNYTAITIGPIISTLSLARRPRELWSASYLFSYLMECIIESVPKGATIISPAKIDKNNQKNEVGLYPDRIYIKGMELSMINEITEKALKKFSERIKISLEDVKNYFNIMGLSLKAEHDKEAINTLNNRLTILELNSRTVTNQAYERVNELIQNVTNSPLFPPAFDRGIFQSLAKIATHELQDKLIEEKDDDTIYKQIKDKKVSGYKSYHKYFCIVYADGDNISKIVSSLDDGKLEKFSGNLLQFGISAFDIIKKYGGMPIYAGGDDLLFIAPVASSSTDNIFSLISCIDCKYKEYVSQKVEDYLKNNDNDRDIHTSMSYGLSITYYKYPLYEALALARKQLNEEAKKLNEEAKNMPDKNAIAWNLRKHSGSSFSGKLGKGNDLYHCFENLINVTTTSERLVSAVSHKLRANKALLELLIGKETKERENRLDCFYKEIIDTEAKTPEEKSYLNNTKELLNQLYKDKDKKNTMDDIIPQVYGMLRTAKFIKGEEDER